MLLKKITEIIEYFDWYFIIELRRVTQLSFMREAAMRIYIGAPSSEPIKLSAAKRLLAISGPAGND